MVTRRLTRLVSVRSPTAEPGAQRRRRYRRGLRPDQVQRLHHRLQPGDAADEQHRHNF